jgi:hypothetical protein
VGTLTWMIGALSGSFSVIALTNAFFSLEILIVEPDWLPRGRRAGEMLMLRKLTGLQNLTASKPENTATHLLSCSPKLRHSLEIVIVDVFPHSFSGDFDWRHQHSGKLCKIWHGGKTTSVLYSFNDVFVKINDNCGGNSNVCALKRKSQVSARHMQR